MWYRYLSYGLEWSYQQNVVTQGILSYGKTEAHGSLIADTWNSIKAAIVRFVQLSSVLEKHFSGKDQKFFSSTKKIAKGTYIRMLRYNFYFTSRSKPIYKKVEIRRTQEMTKVLSKVHKLDDRKIMKHFILKNGLLQSSGFDGVASHLGDQNTMYEVDSLFLLWRSSKSVPKILLHTYNRRLWILAQLFDCVWCCYFWSCKRFSGDFV